MKKKKIIIFLKIILAGHSVLINMPSWNTDVVMLVLRLATGGVRVADQRPVEL